MTIEQILECSADALEAMSDSELLEHFKPYLNVTRPDLAPKPEKREMKTRNPYLQEKQSKKNMVMEILAKQGIKVKL